MKQDSGLIARERLRSIIGKENQQPDEETMNLLRKEIGNIILRYVDVELDNIEVKIILKEYKKRDKNA